MVNCTEVRPGNYYLWDGVLYECQNIDLNKTAMAKMKVKIKSRNVRTGSITEVSLIGGDKVEIVRIDKRKMGFLYDEGEDVIFMDNETYEQLPVNHDLLGNGLQYLKEGVEVDILLYEGEILGINLPAKVTLQVVESPDAVKGDTSKTALKDAICDTGLKTKVPLFVKEGDDIIVSTETGEYVSRA